MRITDISVKRPVTTTVIFLALIVVGVFSLGRLALDLIPDITFPVIGIYAPYAGAAPEEVEENLTKLLELHLLGRLRLRDGGVYLGNGPGCGGQ
jgi:HAE1 family hydrophobic/amphiphilic exporter-1